MHHGKVPENLKTFNKSYEKIDLPFVTYVLGHGDNTSVIRGIRSNQVSAKTYKAQRVELEKWLYCYFKINKKYK